MERNVLLTIAYDGTDFSGWQRQPGSRTVQGELEQALSVICAQPVQIDGTSRTDAGVHALGQRATLRGSFAIPAERIPYAVNGLLAGSGPYGIGPIRVLAAQEMPEGFHARFDAVGKTYRYCLRTGPAPDLFERNRAYFLERPLNVSAMEEAARSLIGTCDFKSFQAAGGNPVPDTVRTITGCTWDERPDGSGGQQITFEVTGTGFLYHMVRNIVGTLVEIGQGKRPPEEMQTILAAQDRTKAGHTAPPQGLFLKQIYYSREEMENASCKTSLY